MREIKTYVDKGARKQKEKSIRKWLFMAIVLNYDGEGNAETIAQMIDEPYYSMTGLWIPRWWKRPRGRKFLSFG